MITRYEDMSPEQIQETKLEELQPLRKECYERLAAGMVTPDIIDWSKAMTAKHGEAVIVSTNYPLSWPAALAVVIYGGAPVLADGTVFWPAQFSENDIKRAALWLSGKNIPQGIIYIRGA